MKCRVCNYTWIPRVRLPKSCPSCKFRFDYELGRQKSNEFLKWLKIQKRIMKPVIIR